MTQVVEIWQGTSVTVDYASYTLEVDESYAFTWQSQITGNSNFLLYEDLTVITPLAATSTVNYASPTLTLTGSQYDSSSGSGTLSSGTATQYGVAYATAYVYFNGTLLASLYTDNYGSSSVAYTLPSGSGTLTCTVKGAVSSSQSFTADFSGSTQTLTVTMNVYPNGTANPPVKISASATYATTAGGIPVSHTMQTDTSGNFNIDSGNFTITQTGEVAIANNLTVSGYVHAANNYISAYSGTLRPTVNPITYSITIPAGKWAGSVFFQIFFVPASSPSYSYGVQLSISGAISASTTMGSIVLTDVAGGTSSNYPPVLFTPCFINLTSTGGSVTFSFSDYTTLSGLTSVFSGNSDKAFAIGVNLYLID